MLRRSCISAATAWEFGQPTMGTGFGKVHINKPDSSHIVDAGVQRTKLGNGVTILTHDKGGAQGTVGFFAESGAKFDPMSAPGLIHMQRHALLTSNMLNSMYQVDRGFRAIGAAYGSVEVNKRYVGAWAAANRSNFRALVDQMAPAFAAPRFCESDLEKWRDNLDAQREEGRWNHPRDFVVDELERIAFYKEPLGQPRIVPPECNDLCSSAQLFDKYASTMTPDRVTVVGVNVAHQDLVSAYENQPMPHSSAAPHHARAARPAIDMSSEQKQYYPAKTGYYPENRSGAMGTKPDQDQEGIVAIGWLSAGGDVSVQEKAAALVHAEMVGMAAQDAMFNPGRQQTAHGVAAFYRGYSSAGLVGVTIRGAPATLVPSIEKALKIMPTDFTGPLAAAKSRAAVRFFQTSMESDVDYAAFLASSQWSAAEVLAAIEATTPNKVSEVANIVRSRAPCMFATGDVMHIPSLRQLGQ